MSKIQESHPTPLTS